MSRLPAPCPKGSSKPSCLPRIAASLGLVGLVAVVACARPPAKVPEVSQAMSAARCPPCAGDDPSQVVAVYSGKSITQKDVEALVGKELRAKEREKFDLRSQAAEELVLRALFEEEAAKAGKPVEAWLQAQFEGKLKAPSDEEITKVYEANKDQMPPGSTLESMRPQIVAFLQRDARRDLQSKLQDELKQKVGYRLQIQPPVEPRVTVEAKGPVRGPADAPVTIVEFSDFQCPYCSRAEATVDQVMAAFAGKVRLVFRHYPLPFHEKAGKAAEAAACADQQGKFWAMHKELFAHQDQLGVDELKKHAERIGLDAARFSECLDSGKMKAVVDGDLAAGKAAGVEGTPAFFVNGLPLAGALPFAEFERVVNAELSQIGK